ncbi:hypothetical protein HK102_007495 [Quaeritorhiza haematococci]|nr:hypothetical protein HK102_007495 [Quaeritorhiza haematococci]
MARNEEKAQSMLYRFREAQAIELGLKKTKEKRPYLASECHNLGEADKWRGQIIREISKKVSKIQDVGLTDFQVRDLNDEINKLLREKRHWEDRIRELGGPDYRRVGPKMLDHEGKEVPGNRGYKYFGRAKDLPGVRELFEQEVPEAPKRTRHDMYRNVDADYYGYRDEDDGVLVQYEAEQQKLELALAAAETLSSTAAITTSASPQTSSTETADKGPSESPPKKKLKGPAAPPPTETEAEGEGKNAVGAEVDASSKKMAELLSQHDFVGYVPVPSQKEVEAWLVRRRQQTLAQTLDQKHQHPSGALNSSRPRVMAHNNDSDLASDISTSSSSLSHQFSTLCLHADTPHLTPDISPPLHVSTTYRHPNDYNDKAAIARGLVSAEYLAAVTGKKSGAGEVNVGGHHEYSRDSIETRSRVEKVLGALEGGTAITYASGLAAATALFQCVQPKRVYMSKEGYHGTHGVVGIYTRGRPDVEVIYIEDRGAGVDPGTLHFQEGDLVWLESPQNPRGEIYDVERYAKRKAPGAILAVDCTFSPPPVQYGLQLGADIVMHSSTKFLGGHSDLLGGVLITKDKEIAKKLDNDRMYLGGVMGNLEAWLLLRSLRTLKLRIRQHSYNATQLADWLHSKMEPCLGIVDKVWHGSIEGCPGHDVVMRHVKKGYEKEQLWSGVFSIEFKSHHHARLIPNHLKIFANATSLGGCESLIEWRAAVDPKISPRLCRVSVGLEDLEDLEEDWRNALKAVAMLVEEIEEIESMRGGN